MELGQTQSKSLRVFDLSVHHGVVLLHGVVYCQVQRLLSELGAQCCAEDGFKLEMAASKPALSFLEYSYRCSYQELAKVALADLYAR